MKVLRAQARAIFSVTEMKRCSCARIVFISLACFAVISVIYAGPWVEGPWVDSYHMETAAMEVHFFNHETRGTNGCSVEPLRIVVLVMTLPASFEARKTIRETWMQTYDQTQVNLTLKFVIGTLSVQKNLTRSLLNESEQYGDLLLMDKLKETYSNLPLKVMKGLRWASDNLSFDYLVKTDDDMYLRIDVLSQTLREMNCEEMLYWGKFLAGEPLKSGHNSEKNWLLCRHYFPYAAGGGYVLAEKVIKSAMPTSERVRFYSNEDVTVGGMLVPFNVKRVHDSRFITHGARCINDFILVNVDKNERLYEIQTKLSQDEDFCEPGKATTGQVFSVELEHLPSLRSYL